ncbi:MAG: DUF2892 domain-containing protein [Flavobacteriales bacterium]|nr:DUF2892 domain-containing protein [Flavobacteriales bacterium]
MKQNMGTADKIIRVIIALVFSALYITGTVSGIFGYILLGLGAIFILTSIMSFCPLYLPFGLNTCSKK